MVRVPVTKAPKLKSQERRGHPTTEKLRPIQYWVPDVRAPGFRKEARKQSAAVAASARARQDQAYIDAVSVSLDGDA